MTDAHAPTAPSADAPWLERWLWRFRYWWAPANFAAGVGSFFLINRQEAMGLWLAGFLLLGWLAILAEGTLGRWIGRWRPQWAKTSPWLLRFVTQGIHQETFFFALPFLLHTTTWASAQAVFTGVVALAALASTWDPAYHRHMTGRPAMFLAYHALSIYVATLILLPTFVHLTTQETLAWAALAVAVLAVPSLAQLAETRRLRHWFASFAGAAGLGVLAWLYGPWVPPVTLWINEGVISQQVDEPAREPGANLREISVADLNATGLYAYSAIRAPRGLKEQVFHVWVHEGKVVDRIPLHIEGGREQGYRAWTRKTGFPGDSVGGWKVQVMTEGGQLIGEMRFRVSAGPSAVGPDEGRPAEGAGPGVEQKAPAEPDTSGAEGESSPHGDLAAPRAAVVPPDAASDHGDGQEQGKQGDAAGQQEKNVVLPAQGDAQKTQAEEGDGAGGEP